MASRFLTRSKALTLAISRSDVASSPALAGTRWFRALSFLPHNPAAPSPSPPVVGSPLGLGKILGYEQTSRLSGFQVLPCWFSTRVTNRSPLQQGQISQSVCKTAAGMENSDALKAKVEASSEVVAFSPLEASITKPRSSPLTSESSKIRQSEIATKVSFYMIPTLLLVSKNSISTSVLVLSVFHQIYMFHKEIFLDYVHHEITRKWALIYFKLLLLIMAKDTMVCFNLF